MFRSSDTRPGTFLTLVAVGAVVLLGSRGYSQSDNRPAANDSRKYLKQAHQELEGGVYDAAILQADSALTVDPSSADAFYLKGLALAATGDTASALTTLERGIQAAPLSSRLKLLLARLRLSGSEFDSAEELVDAVLAIKPHEGEALYLKGIIKMHRGDTGAALGLFHQALQIALTRGGWRP